MLRPRIIPSLLIRNKGLTKTVKFQDGRYIGDPLNAVRIFNEKSVDEIMVVDIDASTESRGPDFDLIRKLAAECRMPLCYGGGITTVDEANRIINSGVEKVAISSAVLKSPELISDIARELGSQSVVVVLDVKKRMIGSRYEVYVKNGTKGTGVCPFEFAQKAEALGAGEIVINSIDRDGAMEGYDLALVRKIRAATTLPLTVLGGAGTLEDIASLIDEFGIIGAGAGSFFLYKGVYKAVLINYPSPESKDALFNKYIDSIRS